MAEKRECEGYDCGNILSAGNRSGLCRSCSNKKRFQGYDPRTKPAGPAPDAAAPATTGDQGELPVDPDKPEGLLFDLDERWLLPEVRHRALAYRFGYMVRNNQGTAPQLASLYELLRDDTASSEHRADALALIEYLRSVDVDAGSADLDIIESETAMTESRQL